MTEQRLKFVTLANSGRFTVTELCLEFGISRQCGHKWLERPAQGGAAALADASRAPHSVPLRTSDAIERIVVSERRLHPTWGPKKIRAVLERKHAMEAPPAISTLGEILKRHGMIEARRRRPGAFNVEPQAIVEPQATPVIEEVVDTLPVVGELGVGIGGWCAKIDTITIRGGELGVGVQKLTLSQSGGQSVRRSQPTLSLLLVRDTAFVL